jgi:hypothetical protein
MHYKKREKNKGKIEVKRVKEMQIGKNKGKMIS